MTVLSPLLAVVLAAPNPKFECDRLLAAGAFAHAGGVCAEAGLAQSVATLQRAAPAARPPYDDAGWPARAKTALEAAYAAHQARPEGIVEAAFFVHLAGLARRTLPPEQVPGVARWPLVGMGPPRPTLPDLQDQALDDNRAAVERSGARLRDLQRRAAAPTRRASLEAAVKAGQRELQRLWESRLAALEDAFNKDPKLSRKYWLALAEAYFEADRTLRPADPERRGKAVLEKLRARHANEPEGRVAQLWLAGFAADAGDAAQAAQLMANAQGTDPALEAFYRAHLAWLRGDAAGAQATLKAVKDPNDNLAAHIAALTAELAGDPLKAAPLWESARNLDITQAAAAMARARRIMSWGDAVVGGTAVERVPSNQRRAVGLYLISRGYLDEAAAVLRLMADDEQTAADIPHHLLRVVDAMRARGDDAAADGQLARLARRILGPKSAWAQANAGTVAEWRAVLEGRVVARLQPLLAAGKRVDASTKRAVGPLVSVRTTLVPPPEAARIGLGQKLAAVGFAAEAAGLFRDLSAQGDSKDKRLAAAQAQLDLAVERAREAAGRGVIIGSALGGQTAEGPMPPEVKAVVEAQSELIPLLSEGPARDELMLTRAAIQIEFGQADLVRTDLARIADAQLQSRIGLRAALLLVSVELRSRAQVATRYSRARPGPPEWSAGLRATLRSAYTGRQGDQALTLVNQRLFGRAAQLYESHAQQMPGPAGDWARLAAAVAWTLGLRPAQAVAAWRRATSGQFAAQAHKHLADLLALMGDSAGAARSLEQLAVLDPYSGVQHLLDAIGMSAGDPAERDRLVGIFKLRFPNHPRAAGLLGKQAEVVVPATSRPVGAPPAPQPPCPGGCARPFWPQG